MNKSLTLVLLTLLGGCASSPTPNYDARFGDAVRLGRAAQTLNPQPSTNPVMGMDGKASKEAVDRYHNVKLPPQQVQQQPLTLINIGR